MKTPLPVAVGAVTVAVYVPFPTFVTAPIVPVPDCFVIVTVEPPAVRLLPKASFACTVSTWVAVPFAVIDELTGASVDWAAFAAPGVIATVVVPQDDAPFLAVRVVEAEVVSSP